MWCCRETKRRVRWSRVIVRGQLLGDRPSTRRSRWIAEIRKQKAVSLAGFRFTFSAFPDGEKKKEYYPLFGRVAPVPTLVSTNFGGGILFFSHVGGLILRSQFPRTLGTCYDACTMKSHL